MPRRPSFVARRRDIRPLNVCIGSSPAAVGVLSQPDKSDVICLAKGKRVVARLGRQEKSLVNDTGQVGAHGLTVELIGIVDQQAVGSSFMLWLLARERRRVILCKWRRLDGAPGRWSSPLCPFKTGLSASRWFWLTFSISAELVDAAIGISRARAAFLVLADLSCLAVGVLGAFWRRTRLRDAKPLDAFKIVAVTICIDCAGLTSVVFAYLTVALAIVLTACNRFADLIVANLILGAVLVVGAHAAFFFALHLNHNMRAVGTIAKTIDVLPPVRLGH